MRSVSSVVIAFLFLGASACKTGGSSQALDVEDIESTSKIAPGKFEVACSDKTDASGHIVTGDVTIATADDIRNNQVCFGQLNIYRSSKLMPGYFAFLYSFVTSEPENNGYTLDGVGFKLYSRSIPGTHPLFRCVIPNPISHFVSPQANCEGQTQEAVLGFAWNEEHHETRQLFRCLKASPSGGSYLLTVDTAECIDGYNVEGPVGWVPK